MKIEHLQDAITYVLSKREPLTFTEIAKEIKADNLWRRPSDDRFPAAGQIAARANNYAHLFERIEENPIKLKRRANTSTRISRLTYNTRGWVEPSGLEGKSSVSGLHEADYGFGFEEWLFDFSKLINGYKYGFIEGFRTKNNKHGSQTYNLQLFTINNDEKEKYWVARINNCYVLTDEEQIKIRDVYFAKGWLKEQERQLRRLGLWDAEAKRSIVRAAPNVRFLEEDVNLFDPPIPVQHSTFIDNRNRYLIYEWEAAAEIKSLGNPFKFEPSKPNKNKTVLRSSTLEFQSKEIKQLHRRIAKVLYDWLVETYGSGKIACEVPHNGGYIDMVRKAGDKYVLYEIKTYAQLRKNIREAFGQLMEYAYWIKSHSITELIIVSEKPLDEVALDYLQFLKTEFGIPISYLQIEL